MMVILNCKVVVATVRDEHYRLNLKISLKGLVWYVIPNNNLNIENGSLKKQTCLVRIFF